MTGAARKLGFEVLKAAVVVGMAAGVYFAVRDSGQEPPSPHAIGLGTPAGRIVVEAKRR